MDTDPDDDIIREVEVTVTPREEVLAGLGIEPEAFEAAVGDAFEKREALADRDDEDIPPLEEIEVVIGGVTYKLEDLAEVEVRGWDD